MTTPVFAQNGVLVENIETEVSGWVSAMKPAITRLFFLLVLIDIAWLGINMLLQGATFEGFVAQLIKKILFWGFGLALLEYGNVWADDIIDSFTALAGIAAGTPVTVESLFGMALETVEFMYEGLSFWDSIAMSMFTGLTILMIIALFGFIIFTLIFAYVETSIVLAAGTIVLGLGGSSFTKEYAYKYLHFALLAGMRLFITLLMAKLGQSLIMDWITAVQSFKITDMASGLAGLIIFALLIAKIPQSVVNMMQGAGIQGGDQLAMNTMKMAGMGAMTMATGGAAALTSATKLAQMQAGGGTLKGLALNTVKNIGTSMKQDLSMEAKTDDAGRFQKSGGMRMSHRMQETIKQMKATNEANNKSNENSISPN